MTKTAFITGITGQDGAYLAKFLQEKEYVVHGLVRRSSVDNLQRLRAICGANATHIVPHEGDMTDSASITQALKRAQPDELYNLAAQSDVAVSFASPAYTTQVNSLGVVYLLEALRVLGLEKHTRVYQASTSELFGKVAETPQSETTPFHPRSPYAVSKLHAYWTIINYRESYGMYAANGILFNHESEHRGSAFVTQKIVTALVRWVKGDPTPLRLGNLEAQRDWGYAPEYVEAMWRLLQLSEPRDLVIATGTMLTVREFVNMTAQELGIRLAWQGEGATSCAYDVDSGRSIVIVDPHLYRPAEVDLLCGNATRARELLGWEPKITGTKLIQRMIAGAKQTV